MTLLDARIAEESRAQVLWRSIRAASSLATSSATVQNHLENEKVARIARAAIQDAVRVAEEQFSSPKSVAKGADVILIVCRTRRRSGQRISPVSSARHKETGAWVLAFVHAVCCAGISSSTQAQHVGNHEIRRRRRDLLAEPDKTVQVGLTKTSVADTFRVRAACHQGVRGRLAIADGSAIQIHFDDLCAADPRPSVRKRICICRNQRLRRARAKRSEKSAAHPLWDEGRALPNPAPVLVEHNDRREKI